MIKLFSLIAFCALSTYSHAASLPASLVSDGQQIQIELVTQEKDSIWGFDFLPDGQIIYTLRTGKLKIFDPLKKTSREIKNVPAVMTKNQGGLLDVLLDPEFHKNAQIYFSYSALDGSRSTTRIARANLNLKDNALSAIKILFTAEPFTSATQHFGSRLAIDKSRMLYFSVGDRGERDSAQNLNSNHGKIFHVPADGSAPAQVWSYGHRNPQGLSFHPQTGELWSTEHGPRGGDELNLIKKGANYGWPIITYGAEYWGPKIGTTHKDGMEQPILHYTPSIATCGLMIYSGKKFKKWAGHFFIGALKDTYLSRVLVENNKGREVEKLFASWEERIRSVKESPTGEIYISTDSGHLVVLK